MPAITEDKRIHKRTLYQDTVNKKRHLEEKMAVKENVREQTRSRIKVPKQYQVLIYNDDFTPMDFVVHVLMELFDKDEPTATRLMLNIHKGSYAVAGVYPKDLACTKAAEAVQWAREEGYPLKVEAVCQ